MLALKDVVGRVDLANVVHNARVPELLNERALKTEPLGDRLDIPADSLQVRTGGAVLDRRGEQQVAYGLRVRHIGNPHGLMEKLAEHVAARSLRKIRIAWRDVDGLDHVLGVVVAHRSSSLSYAPGSRGSCR